MFTYFFHFILGGIVWVVGILRGYRVGTILALVGNGFHLHLGGG